MGSILYSFPNRKEDTDDQLMKDGWTDFFPLAEGKQERSPWGFLSYDWLQKLREEKGGREWRRFVAIAFSTTWLSAVS